MTQHHRLLPSARQRGLASLVVVMVLFFVVSLVAAYTNRNLIFEQRTSANYFRSTHSFEVGQAAIDWTTAMLNGGRIDSDCKPSTDPTALTFRDRYIVTDPVSGYISPALKSGTTEARSAACVYDGSSWNCSCPTDSDPTLTVPTGTGIFPAFRVHFTTIAGSTDPGFTRLEVLGCPSADLATGGCLTYSNVTRDEGRQFISVLLGLHSAIKTVPAAPLTVRNTINLSPGAALQAINGDAASGGFALQAGKAAPAPGVGITYRGPGGRPSTMAFVDNDDSLGLLAALPPLVPTVEDRMFSTMFGLLPDDYRQQPAAYVLTGCPCTAAALRTAIQMNPGRPIWVRGALSINSTGDIGSATQPVALIVDGSVTATTAVTVYGVVYVRATPTWTISGSTVFQGAAVAENSFAGDGTSTFAYDAALLQRLRVTTGSFVVMPGSWRDFVR